MLRWQTLEMQDRIVCCWVLHHNTATILCRDSVWPWEVIKLALSSPGSLSHTAGGYHQLLISLLGFMFSLLACRQQTAPISSFEFLLPRALRGSCCSLNTNKVLPASQALVCPFSVKPCSPRTRFFGWSPHFCAHLASFLKFIPEILSIPSSQSTPNPANLKAIRVTVDTG